eukprot:1153131-Pelagomonas_calceolata.AAC.1
MGMLSKTNPTNIQKDGIVSVAGLHSVDEATRLTRVAVLDLVGWHAFCVKHGMSRRKKKRKWAARIKERSPVLKGRAPPYILRERTNTEVCPSKLAPTMVSTTRLSGRPCPGSSRPTPEP